MEDSLGWIENKCNIDEVVYLGWDLKPNPKLNQRHKIITLHTYVLGAVETV